MFSDAELQLAADHRAYQPYEVEMKRSLSQGIYHMSFHIHLSHKFFSNYLLFLIFSLVCIDNKDAAFAAGLSIEKSKTQDPSITYDGKPVIAYGPSPQNILSYLPNGNGNDLKDWIEWAIKFKINNVRSYPPSAKVVSPAQDLFLRASTDTDKFDLARFNEEYFNQLRSAIALLRDHGIIVHLQLWQAIYWKKIWGECYYNPKNNINPDISEHAGPSEFVTMKNPKLLEHQKKYVRKILDATGDLGNVIYDIMNEIGNGTGKSKDWVKAIIQTVNKWESEHRINVLLTLNDEGGKRMGDFSLEYPGLDLIIKDLGRYDEHIKAREKYHKPTISVRNIDYDYETKRRFYFAGSADLEVNKDLSLQTRGRKYWWRMFMSKVQIAGGYADTYTQNNYKSFINRIFDEFSLDGPFSLVVEPSYRLNLESERNFIHFRKFVDRIEGYENLQPYSGVLRDHPVSNSYCLQSGNQAIIYLESPNGKAGFHYDGKDALLTELMLSDGTHKGEFYFPATGLVNTFEIQLSEGKAEINIPPFDDDLAILIY